MLDPFVWALATTICLILLDVQFSNELGPFFWAFATAALLTISFLSYLRFYQKHLAQHGTSLVLALRLWLIAFIFISGIFLLLWLLPEYGQVKYILLLAVVTFLFGMAGFWFDRWSGRHEQSALIRLAGIIERFWLWKIDPKRRKQYEWHGRWRLEVFFRRIRRWFENFDWDRDFVNLRPLYVLAAAGAAYGMLYLALGGETTAWEWLNRTMIAADTSSATLKLALLGAPIAFVIWWFRDNNNRRQIENQRKDINLKDFQKLAEWAAGMHLPEDKLTTGRNGKEKYSARETSTPILDATLPVTSRHNGAASLQIAAFYQLQAFVEGDYGRHFQRPAFQLLKSMWLAVVREQLEEWESIGTASLDEERIAALHRVTNTPLGRAINTALGTTHGRVLRAHADDLPETVFVGFDGMSVELELDSLSGVSLWGIDLRGAVLRRAQLQGTTWELAKLQGADLGDAQLQGADLFHAWLRGANLEGAQLQGANLSHAGLQEANLRNTQLQGADLSHAGLQGANLEGAQLQGAALHDFHCNAHTRFRRCNTDMHTSVLVRRGEAIDPIATLELRGRLRDQNGLILPDILYTQIFATADPLAKKFKILEA